MNKEYETHRLHWEGIDITISWSPDWINPEIISMGHLKLATDGQKPLPMTDTGFRSHFIPKEEVEEYGGPVAFTRAWLDHEAQSPEWKRHVEQSKQMSLF